MAEKYEEKRVYYIPAFVERIENLGNYPVKVSFRIGEERCDVQFEDLPDLMFTAEEVAKENDLDTCEVVVVNKNKKLKAKVACLQEENEKLKADNERLNAYYMEANRTASEAAEANDDLKAKIAEQRAENENLKADRDEWKKVAANNASFHRDACNERDELKTANDDLKAMVNDLKDRLERSKATVEKQSDKLRELQARIVELNEVNSSLGENRDSLNNEAAVHMTGIHNLQVAVEVLAEKIFEMRCEQDG